MDDRADPPFFIYIYLKILRARQTKNHILCSPEVYSTERPVQTVYQVHTCQAGCPSLDAPAVP